MELSREAGDTKRCARTPDLGWLTQAAQRLQLPQERNGNATELRDRATGARNGNDTARPELRNASSQPEVSHGSDTAQRELRNENASAQPEVSHGSDAAQPEPEAREAGPPPSEAPPASSIGQRALEYGNEGRTAWYGRCLEWVNHAVNNSGGNVAELRTPTAAAAFRAAEQNGRIQYSANPPAGAVVFFPSSANGVGHVGIATGDGHYRGTVPNSESKSGIGDRPLPPGQTAWMLPY